MAIPPEADRRLRGIELAAAIQAQWRRGYDTRGIQRRHLTGLYQTCPRRPHLACRLAKLIGLLDPLGLP